MTAFIVWTFAIIAAVASVSIIPQAAAMDAKGQKYGCVFAWFVLTALLFEFFASVWAVVSTARWMGVIA